MGSKRGRKGGARKGGERSGRVYAKRNSENYRVPREVPLNFGVSANRPTGESTFLITRPKKEGFDDVITPEGRLK
jgi:hypothetical protein